MEGARGGTAAPQRRRLLFRGLLPSCIHPLRHPTCHCFCGPCERDGSSRILEMITQRCHRLRLAPRARFLSVTGGPPDACACCAESNESHLSCHSCLVWTVEEMAKEEEQRERRARQPKANFENSLSLHVGTCWAVVCALFPPLRFFLVGDCALHSCTNSAILRSNLNLVRKKNTTINLSSHFLAEEDQNLSYYW
jgi:hypothetical protein